MTKRLAVFLSVLSLLLAPALAWAVNVTTNAKDGNVNVGGTLTYTSQTGEKKTSEAGGTVDLSEGKWSIEHSGLGFVPMRKYIRVTNQPRTVDLQTKPLNPGYLWSPPPGFLTIGPTEENVWIGDAKKTRDIFTDIIAQPYQKFVNRADAATLQSDNNDDAHRFALFFTGLYLAVGLPTFSLRDCECWLFTHAIGASAGIGSVDFHTHDRMDNFASNTYLRGDGFAGGFDYTATAMVRPGMGESSNWGFRYNVGWKSGSADVNRSPIDSQGLGSFGASPKTNSQGSVNWSTWSTSFDVLHTLGTRNLYGFVGVQYREATFDVNTSNPATLPGGTEVSRRIDQSYTNSNVLPRFGLDGMIPPGWLPVWMPPIFARGEATLGPGGSGFMIKVGTGASILPILDNIRKGP